MNTQSAEGPVYVFGPPRLMALLVSWGLAPHEDEDVAPVTFALPPTFTVPALTVPLFELDEVDEELEEVVVEEASLEELEELSEDEVLDEELAVELEEPFEDEELEESDEEDEELPLLLLPELPLLDEDEEPLEAIELASAGLTTVELEIEAPVLRAS